MRKILEGEHERCLGEARESEFQMLVALKHGATERAAQCRSSVAGWLRMAERLAGEIEARGGSATSRAARTGARSHLAEAQRHIVEAARLQAEKRQRRAAARPGGGEFPPRPAVRRDNVPPPRLLG